MKVAVVTLFPELIETFVSVGVIGRAVKSGLISVQLENPRDYTTDVHRTVDDRPFGGGPGMVMKPEPLIAAIEAAKNKVPDARTVYLSPQGIPLTQQLLRQWQGGSAASTQMTNVVLVAGRYEGIDERVIESHIDEEVSVGDYVLSGGEVAAMTVIDALGRLVPGVLGHADSASEDSFGEDGLLDCPHYTRPERLAGSAKPGGLEEPGENQVPAVLLSGDHAAIATWRRQMALKRTWQRRPDLLKSASLTEEDKAFLTRLGAAEKQV